MKNDDHGIIRVHKSRDFSVINNTGLRDARLSFGARGVLAYLLSKPDDWHLCVEDLIRQSPAGQHAVRGMLRELQEFGYLKRERVAGKRGRFEWQTSIYEVPQNGDGKPSADGLATTPRLKPRQKSAKPVSPSTDFPFVDEPQMEKPEMDSPSMENRPIYEGLREEELREQILSERVREGECFSVPLEAARNENAQPEDAPPDAPAHPRFESKSVLDPDPRSEPDLMALKEECNVSLIRPSARDLQFWPDAVATIREALPDKTPEERARAVREFKARWADGGRRGSLYLSQVVTHWARIMDDSLRGDKNAPASADGFPSQATSGAERVRRAREAAYSPVRESAGRTS